MKLKCSPTTLGLLAVVILSSYSPFIKLLLQWFHPFTIIAVGQVATIVTLLLVYGLYKEIHKFHTVHTQEIFLLIVMGILSSIIAPMLMLKGLSLSSAINGVLIGRMQPIFLFILSVIILHEKIGVKQCIGILIMLFGTGWITTNGYSGNITLASGDVLIALAALLYAGSTTVFKKWLTHLNPEMIVLARNTIGAIFFLIVLPVNTGFTHNIENIYEPNHLLAMVGFAVLTSALGQVLWYSSLQYLSESKTAFLSLLSPISGIIFAMILVGETLNIHHSIGTILIILGLTISVLHRPKLYDWRFIHRLGHWHK